jgi:hypothetical protein
MKLMAWNCRGLGNSPAVRGLLRCQKSVDADILFLSETKMDERRMEKMKFKLGMGNMVVVDSEGKGGELLCCGGEESMWWLETSRKSTLIWMCKRRMDSCGALLESMENLRRN